MNKNGKLIHIFLMKERKCKENYKKFSNTSEEKWKRIFKQCWSNMDWNQKKGLRFVTCRYTRCQREKTRQRSK